MLRSWLRRLRLRILRPCCDRCGLRLRLTDGDVLYALCAADVLARLRAPASAEAAVDTACAALEREYARLFRLVQE